MSSTIRSFLLGGHRRSRCAAPIVGVLLGVSICVVAIVPPAASATAQTSSATRGPLALSIGPEQLSELNLGGLGLSKEELTKLLGGLSGAGGETALAPILSLLDSPGATVQQLLQTVEHVLGGSLTPEQIVTKVTEGATNPQALAGLLSGLAQVLNGEQLAQLQQIVERLLGSLSPAQLEQIEKSLGSTGSIPELANALIDELLGGGPQSAVEALLGDLNELLAVTGSEAAEVAGVPLETLASTLDETTKALSEATGITGILPTKELLDVISNPGSNGLTVGVVPSGAGSSTSTTTNTATEYTTSAAAKAASKAAKKAGKVTILSDRAIGNVLDLVVRTPSAGRLTISAAHLKAAHRRVGRARAVTFTLHLTKASAASLRHKNRSLEVKVKAAFTPTSGSKSSATATVKFG